MGDTKKILFLNLFNFLLQIVNAQYNGIEWLSDFNPYDDFSIGVIEYNQQNNKLYKSKIKQLENNDLNRAFRLPQIFRSRSEKTLFQDLFGIYNGLGFKTYTYSYARHFTKLNHRYVETDDGLMFDIPNKEILYAFIPARMYFNLDSVINYEPGKLYRLHLNSTKPIDSFAFINSGGVGHGFVRHLNNNDVWVLSRSAIDSKIDVFKIDSTGINYSHSVNSPDGSKGKISGNFIFSADGRKGALVTGSHRNGLFVVDSMNWSDDSNGELLLFDFNPLTGGLSNFTRIYTKQNKITAIHGQLAFTGDGRYLFVYLGDSLNLIDMREIRGYEDICLEETSFKKFSSQGVLKTLFDGKIYTLCKNTFNDSLFIRSIGYNSQDGLTTNDRALFIGKSEDQPMLGLNRFQRTLYPLCNLMPSFRLNCTGDSAKLYVELGFCDSVLIDWGDNTKSTYHNVQGKLVHEYPKIGDFRVILHFDTPWQEVHKIDTLIHITLKSSICIHDTFYCPKDTLRIELMKYNPNLRWDFTEYTRISIFEPGDYGFHFLDSWCNFTDYIKVEKIPQPWQFPFHDTIICNGETVIVDVPSYLKCQWNGISVDSSKTKEFSNTGIYSLRFSNESCVFYDTLSVTVIPPLDFDVVQTDSGECHLYSPMEFNVKGAISQMISISWNSEVTNSILYTTNDLDSVYVTVGDKNGCKETAAINPSSLCKPSVFIPNVITPNGLGPVANERFKPLIIDGALKSLSIYNRWGQKIYDDNSTEGWDGTYQLINVPQGTYFYELQVITILNNDHYIHRYSGNFQLLR
jgi:gliding motility-associated-like protein